MKRTRVYLILLVVLCLLAGCGTEPTSTAIPTLTPTPPPLPELKGKVLDESSGLPVEGAQVTAGGCQAPIRGEAMSIKSWLKDWLLGDVEDKPVHSLDTALDCYQTVLLSLEGRADAMNLLFALTQRDQVAKALVANPSMPTTLQRLSELDGRLKKKAQRVREVDWDAWRLARNPSSDYWWWRLDEKRDFGWILVAGILVTLTFTLVVEVLRRLLGGGSDWLSTTIAAVSIVLTGGALTKYGRDVADWIYKRISKSRLGHSGQATMIGAFVGFAAILAINFFVLPLSARYYNNRGKARLDVGELTMAHSDFQKAVSLNRDYVAAYYNLASMYEQTADYGSAIELYTQALQHDLSFAPAYNNLGRAYILQKEYDWAIPLLRQGMTLAQDEVTLSALHTNLGRVYYEVGRYGEAETELQKAIEKQPDEAAAYCYLALTYEALVQFNQAMFEWERCLVKAEQQTAEGSEWATMANAHLDHQEKNKP